MTNPADLDSNDVTLSLADETGIGIVSNIAVWRQREPNSFADFGGTPTLASRAIIGSRKRQAGSIVGIDVKGGWNEDFTMTNWRRQLQKLFCNLLTEKGDTSGLAIGATVVALTSVANSDSSFNAASGLDAGFIANALIMASGFTNAANNGLMKVTGAPTSTKIITNSTLTTEASPPAAARLEVVGQQAASADLVAVYSGGVFSLTSTALNFTTLGLHVGEWIFIGGDNAGSKFVTITPGYARIYSIAAHAIVFDKTTFVPSADAGTGQKIQLFFGKYIRDPASPTIYTSQLERLLGNDGAGTQSEYVLGALFNEATLNWPKKDKITLDAAYLGIDYEHRSGATGIKASSARIAPLGESALNTSSDVFRATFAPAPLSSAAINLTPYFGYVTDGTFKLSNNGSVDEAIGSQVGFDINTGDFTVEATFNAYFSVLQLLIDLRQHTLATVDMIVARNNAGWIFDLPVVELKTSMPKPEKDKPIMVPVQVEAVQNANGYLCHFQSFSYLPAVAMPLKNVGFAGAAGFF